MSDPEKKVTILNMNYVRGYFFHMCSYCYYLFQIHMTSSGVSACLERGMLARLEFLYRFPVVIL